MSFVRKLPVAGTSPASASFADAAILASGAVPNSYEFATSMTDPGG